MISSVNWYAVNAREQTGLNRFRSILADQSPYARAYAREEVGRYLRNQGRFPEALAEYRAAAEIAPHNPRLLVSMAELEYRSGRADAALATLSRALEENPDHGPGLELSARILAERGQAADALAMYARAVGAAPERTDLAERLVTLMLQAQGVAATQAGLRDALRTEPSSRLARTCLALALWLPIRANPAAGATPAGRQDLREALRLLEELASRHALNDHLSRVAADLRTTIARSPSPE